jgi:hypothetical protein
MDKDRREGIKGMANPGRYGIERVAYWLMRITGIRLMIAQAGFGFGKPRRPDYPYTPSSLNMKNKLCIYVSIGLAALAMMYGLGVMYDV